MFRLLTFVFLFAASTSPLFAQEIVFEDRFEGSLKPGWVWLRENASCRRFVNNSLEILFEPFGAGEARNALARPLNFFRWRDGKAEGAYRVETMCSFVERPTAQFQQCGLYWLQNDRVVFKLVCECVDGKTYIYPSKTPVDAQGVKLRLTVVDQKVVAEFCCENETSFRRVYEGRLEIGPEDRVGVQCWNGPRDNKTQWARFHYFRVEKLTD
ncbi:MAG: hypothetical protein IKW13_07355 [Thermoguttaceae bacterium]|nr:hypothetical protein [Thermoguttaceae bacterium]MBR5244034.1 hypothetical protein [Thermoguttaceae bacterium]